MFMHESTRQHDAASFRGAEIQPSTTALAVSDGVVVVAGVNDYLRISCTIYRAMGRRFGPMAALRECWRWLTSRWTRRRVLSVASA